MTTKTTFTPGPWTKHRRSYADVWRIRGKDKVLIADDLFLEADANLIAAAPDLLAALKGMLDQPETNAAYDTMMQRAQAAIAKAEGRTP